MSGRLIILPKKSWHVWRKDNIEKVLRDERLAGEADKAQHEQQRAIEQEWRLEQLKAKAEGKKGRQGGAEGGRGAAGAGGGGDGEWAGGGGGGGGGNRGSKKRPRAASKHDDGKGGVGAGWGRGGLSEHVNLFSEAEAKASAAEPSRGGGGGGSSVRRATVQGNADYKKEQELKEQLEQKRNGTAPWGLGDIAEESARLGGPWYRRTKQEHMDGPTTAFVRGRTVVGEVAELALDRDERRKDRADPLQGLIRPKLEPKQEPDLDAQDHLQQLRLQHPQLHLRQPKVEVKEEGVGGGGEGGGREEDKQRRRHSKVKEEEQGGSRRERNSSKKSKKKKHKSDKKDRKRRRSSSTSNSRNASDGEEEGKRVTGPTEAEQRVMDLRVRRLQREAREGRRAVQLLAEREMLGLPVPDERDCRYHGGQDAMMMSPEPIDEDYEDKMTEFASDCDEGKGDAVACHSVGEFLSVVRSDWTQAAKVYRQNVDRYNHAPSAFNLGRLNLGGKGVPQSNLEAYKLFQVGCKADPSHAQSCHHAAMMLLAGIKDVPKDPHGALALLQKACDDQTPESCYTLASELLKTEKEKMYVPRDPLRAKRLLEMACAKMHAPACYNLAVMYKHGDKGVPKDEHKFQEFATATEQLIEATGALEGTQTV